MSHHYIAFSNVKYRYPNGHEALKGIDFRINHGEKVALLGLNGAGKSTLLLHINGLLLPSEGEVNIGGVPVTKKTAPRIRQEVGMLFQNADNQLFMPTVEEDVAFGPANMLLEKEEIERRVTSALETVGASDLRKRSPSQLSGGQKKRVALATILSMEPSIMVMDEPTAELDLKARENVMEIIKGFSHTCLIATHDLDLAEEICPKSLLIDDGKIIFYGNTQKAIEYLRKIGGNLK